MFFNKLKKALGFKTSVVKSEETQNESVSMKSGNNIYEWVKIDNEELLGFCFEKYKFMIRFFDREVDFIVSAFDKEKRIIEIHQYLDGKVYQVNEVSIERFFQYYPDFVFIGVLKT